MRRWFVFCLITVSVLLAGARVSTAAQNQPAKTRLLYFSSFPEIMQQDDEPGLAELAGAIRAETDKNPNTFFVNGGASFGPSVFGAMDNGAHMVDILNAISPSVMAIGKREFSYGFDNFILNALSANFPLVTSNLVDAHTGGTIDATYPTYVLEGGPVLVGVIALTSANSIEEYGAEQARLVDTAIATANAAALLRDEGAEAIILLADTDYDDLSVYQKDGTVDVIFYAHNFDNPQSLDAQGSLLQQGALDGKIIAVDLWLDRSADGNMALRSSTELLDLKDYAPATDVAAIVSDYRTRLAQLLGPGIAEVTTEFDTIRANIRSRENPFANLVTDALRAQVNADVMILNGGSIRGNITYPAGHQISRGDIQRELPFGNKTALLLVNGSDILESLEHGIDCGIRGDGCFTHVSNLMVEYDSSKPRGSRVIVATIGGQTIQPNGSYRLAVSDFMAAGNDGFSFLKDAERLYDAGTNRLIWNVVAEYVEQLGTISPRIEGRMVDIAEPGDTGQ